MKSVSKEQVVVGASYLFSFQQLVEVLTNESATYINYLCALNKKYKKISFDDKSTLTPQEKASLVDLAQRIRSLVFNCYVKLNSFDKAKDIKKTDWNNFEKLYNNIMKTGFIVNDDKLQDYVISVNSLFVKTISAQTLLTSHDVLKAFGGVTS